MTDGTLNPEAIRADMEAGTLGPFEACDPGDYSDYNGRSIVVLGEDIRIVVVLGEHEEAKANARRIARLPDLEQGYLEEVDENAALRARAEAAEAREARLREAVDEIAGMGVSEPMTWSQSPEAWERRRANLMQGTARAALTDTQEGRE